MPKHGERAVEPSGKYFNETVICHNLDAGY